MFEEMTKKASSWLISEGANSTIVLSSRTRLARNISGNNFPPLAKNEHREKVFSYVKSAFGRISYLKKGNFYSSEQVGELERNFLIERHLISPEFMREKDNQGLFIGDKETLSIMVNEEDHLRIQAIQPGLALSKAWELAAKVDEELSKWLKYDFDPQLGYLTACPTNVGTGMRASVLIHLPAMVLTREIDSMIAKITKAGLSVRGFYGEGTDVLGNLFQVSNQTSLGPTEEEIIENLEKVTLQIIEQEEKARDTLFKEAKDQIEDKIWRAYGILRYARVLTSAETMNLLSAVRLGLGTGILNQVSLALINELLLFSQPAHLQKFVGREMDPNERDFTRAELIRNRLNGFRGAAKNKKEKSEGT